MRIILGSSSKFRQQVLSEMGYEFDIVSPDIDEKSIRFDNPETLVLAIAHAKADEVSRKIEKPAIVIAADQVVTINGTIREKPSSPDEARDFLRSYGTEPSKTINGVVVLNSATGKKSSGTDIVTVYLKPIPDDVIDKLISQGVILSCAGALRLEDRLMQPYITEIDGTQESLMGMPKELTKSLILKVS